MMLGAVDGWRKWALFTVPEGGEWEAIADRLKRAAGPDAEGR